MDLFKNKIRRGVDAKLMQYERNVEGRNICETKIDIKRILEDLLKEQLNHNCIMINLEKDKDRYEGAVRELQKISIDNFIHLKGTYWKDKKTLEKDLTFIKNFLGKFTKVNNDQPININEFSDINDENVHIQDGPLGCYCSHLRAWIYAYLNFEHYTIVVEDDLSITNTENILKYLPLIPDDWDLICLGAVGKDRVYDDEYYKFTHNFHSTHFYIVNHKCLKVLFENMYPITDQVDVLMSDLIHKINIYNIPDTVYQKCISTNTQNNLHTIFSAKYYDVLREQINIIKKSCMFFAHVILPDNYDNNEIIVSNILYDVLYPYITDFKQNGIDDDNKDDTDYLKEFIECSEYSELFCSMVFFIQCSKKVINVTDAVFGLMNNIFGILKGFRLHNVVDDMYNEIIKAYNYGSTCQTYFLAYNNVIIKAYNGKLRWTVEGHNNSLFIFRKELEILKMGNKCAPQLLDWNEDKLIIKMAYCGQSLYNDFILPDNWANQIVEIFDVLTSNNIFYPEFKLQNILVLNGKITFVDYGLAVYCDNVDNKCNCEKFIKLLGVLEGKFKGIDDREKRYELYSTFIHNMELDKVN